MPVTAKLPCCLEPVAPQAGGTSDGPVGETTTNTAASSVKHGVAREKGPAEAMRAREVPE